MDRNCQILFDETNTSVIECLIYSVKPNSRVEESSFPFDKNEDFFANRSLRQALQRKSILNLVFFSLNESKRDRPMQLLEIAQCRIIAEGKSGFRLTKIPSNLDELQQTAFLQKLQQRLCLPQNSLRKLSAKRQSESEGTEPQQQAKRQQMNDESSAAIVEFGSLPPPILDYEEGKVESNSKKEEQLIIHPPVVPPAQNQIEERKSSAIVVSAKRDIDLSEQQQPGWLETKWDGIQYKSKLEARYACFMKYANVNFRYEPMKTQLEAGLYTPDFWLPEQKMFIEVKPAFPNTEELYKCEITAANGFDIVCMYGRVGEPMADENHKGPVRRTYDHSGNFRGMAWSGITGERLPGDWMFIWDEQLNKAVMAPLKNSRDRRWDNDKLRMAYEIVYHHAFGPA